jgi:hypothetical protein
LRRLVARITPAHFDARLSAAIDKALVRVEAP